MSELIDAVEQRRVRRGKSPTEGIEHTITPITKAGSKTWHRECTCGWHARRLDRQVVMDEAKLHRLRVVNYARLVKRGMAEFVVPQRHRLTEQERADLRRNTEAIRRAFSGR